MNNKLILGTVQFGLNYGINNTIGQLEKNQVLELLKIAFNQGIRFLDTAELYGDAHEIIGDFHKKNKKLKFKVITKFPHNIKNDSIKSKVFDYIDILNVTTLEVLMFHSFDSFRSNYKSLEVLKELKRNGFIGHIGVSVYTNTQLESLLNEDLITVVQLPFNLLDNFNVRGELLDKLKKKGKIIHTRSVFLQGLFFKNINDKTAIVQKLKTELELLKQLTIELNCSMEELALSYSLSQQNIDNIIIGVDSIFQLKNNVRAASYKIEQETLKHVNNIQVENLELLNPSLWN
jgi:uncharacterized protein